MKIGIWGDVVSFVGPNRPIKILFGIQLEANTEYVLSTQHISHHHVPY